MQLTKTHYIIIAAIVTVIIIAIAVAIYMKSKNTYTYVQGVDSPGGGNVQQASMANNIPALQDYCNATPDCKGFNTNGWIKSTLVSTFKKEPTFNKPNQGFYVKSGNTVPLIPK